MSKIYVAAETVIITVDGKRHHLRKDVTRVREGHPLLKGREHLFKELDVHYDVEEARAKPGTKRKKADADVTDATDDSGTVRKSDRS